MPLVRVSRRRGWPTAENKALLDAVHAALVEAFKIPDGDRHQQLIEVDPTFFEIPADRTEAFTLVEITAFPGRSLAAKGALYEGLARRCKAVGVSPSDLFVVLLEPPMENWSPRGGVSSADKPPPFKLGV